MTLNEYWNFIETVRDYDGAKLQKRLRCAFQSMPKQEFEWISAWHHKLRTDAHRIDAWSFAICAFGGCGDTAFQNFICWLPWQGRDLYHAVLNDPDSLVRELKKYTYISDEELGVMDVGVAQERFGEDFKHPFESNYPVMTYDWIPEETFPEVFPKIYAAFGERWLNDYHPKSYNAVVRAAKKRQRESLGGRGASRADCD